MINRTERGIVNGTPVDQVKVGGVEPRRTCSLGPRCTRSSLTVASTLMAGSPAVTLPGVSRVIRIRVPREGTSGLSPDWGDLRILIFAEASGWFTGLPGLEDDV